jgi:transposase
MFENKAIEMLETMTTKAVAKQMKLGWDAIDNIKQRAVERGKQRRQRVEVRDAAIDETSFQKGHDYIATIINQEDGTVLDVLPDRDAKTVKNWFKRQETADFKAINSIAMDMSGSFQKAVEDTFANWKDLICFDRFHVSQLFNKALDKVRRREWALLDKEDSKHNPLKKKRFGFLKNSGRIDNRSGKRREFLSLTRMNLQTCRAWRIKENASVLWNYEYMAAAKKNWKSLLWWIAHCRIPEMIKVGKTIKEHLWGILNAIRMKINNAIQESTNSSIQRIKKMACGYLNKRRFMTDVLFHFGNLDMAVAPL